MLKIDREDYIKEYREMAEDVIEKEQLPFTSDVLAFALNGEKSDRLNHMIEFFDNEEELREQTTRKSLIFTSDESSNFIDSVIAANISDISESGTIYKQLQACGDSFRIRGHKDCGSKGRPVQLPITETEFLYKIRNSYIYINDPEDLMLFDSYDEFCKATVGESKIYVRSPLTCKHATKKGCCPICAGELPEGIQNLGAFATLMITEVATQNALSSMNKGKKKNVNTLLTQSAGSIKTIEDFYNWCEGILNELEGDKVERRYYEIAMLGRFNLENGKIRVSSLANPDSKNYFGEFIYRPKEKSFRNIVANSPFIDDSLKGQIALNSYSRSNF